MNPAAIPSLSARGLQKDFIQPNGERLTVLKSVDFDIYPGEMVAIMGPSGSGKSTLLQILGLMMRPDKGELSILGGDAAVMTESARDHLRRGKIGFLFQMDSLMEELTLEENLRLIQRIKGIGFAGEPVSNLSQVAGRLNLERRLPSFPRELSVGECCRANLLRA
ncbi:MAG: ATP-binding cassette domain-containing protein [Elusimicrobia bacterium]|nr:ATP-binding cassette domain-containing protein [Elusimicrobiota bacterium]